MRGYPEGRFQTFTQDCVPVRDDRFSNATGFHYEEFSDVTLGFHDPNIFIPPTGCQSAAAFRACAALCCSPVSTRSLSLSLFLFCSISAVCSTRVNAVLF